MRARDIRAQRAVKQRHRSKPDQETAIDWDAIKADPLRQPPPQP